MKSFGCAVEVKPYEENAEERAKIELSKTLCDLFEALACDDDFWIVKDTTSDPIGGKRYIGWRIEIPHMKDE